MKILFIQLGRIGDMVLLTSAIKAVKEKYPDSVIDVLAGRNNYQVIKDNPKINNIIIYDKSPFSIIKTIADIRKTGYDYYIDPKDHHSTESRLIARFVKSAKKIGFNNIKKKIYDFSITSDVDNEGLHSITRIFNSLKPLSISIDETIPSPELFINPESGDYVITFLEKNKIRDFILINLSAGSKARMLAVKYWSEILNKILNDYKIVLCFAKSETETANSLAERFNDIKLFNSRSINDVISLVNRAKLLITPNTALVHIASAFDTPILAFYVSNDEDFKKFKPLSTNQKIFFLSEKSELIKNLNFNDVVSAIKLLY